MTPADVINANQLFFTRTIRDTITRLKGEKTIKTWTRAMCFVVKPPETETSVRFYNLKSLLLRVSDVEMRRAVEEWAWRNDDINSFLIRLADTTIGTALGVWAHGFEDRVERDTKIRSRIRVIGTDKIIIHLARHRRKQRGVKGHRLKSFGRGRSMIFHPTSSHCLIHSLKAHNYLKKRIEQYDASVEFRLNEMILPYDECDLLYEYKANGYGMDDLSYLESENDMCINVYCMSEKEKYEASRLVIARTGNPIYRQVVYLMLVDNDSHMCLIVHFNKFMSMVTRSTDTYFCSKCLWRCDENDKGKITHHHDALCYNMKTTLRFPVKGVDNCVLKFDKNGRTHPGRCFVVFDTESYLEKSNNNSNIISTHKVIGYSYIIIDRVLGPVFERYYVGDNAGDLLLKNLERDWMYLREHIIKISKKRSYSFAFNPLTSKNPENIEVAMVYQSSTPQFYKTT